MATRKKLGRGRLTIQMGIFISTKFSFFNVIKLGIGLLRMLTPSCIFINSKTQTLKFKIKYLNSLTTNLRFKKRKLNHLKGMFVKRCGAFRILKFTFQNANES